MSHQFKTIQNVTCDWGIPIASVIGSYFRHYGRKTILQEVPFIIRESHADFASRLFTGGRRISDRSIGF